MSETIPQTPETPQAPEATAHQPRRQVTVTRVAAGHYTATNDRGAQISFGNGTDEGFTPVELLLAAVGGCSGIDVDVVMTRRGEPTDFQVVVSTEKTKDAEGGVRLADVAVDFTVRMPADIASESLEGLIDRVIRASRDTDCTVSRTVEHATPVTFSREGRAL